jgi:nucleoid DNA-binding protein
MDSRSRNRIQVLITTMGEVMKEGEFIRFYRDRNCLRNIKEAKEKIDLFWTVVLKALAEDGKVSLKDWGVFEKKEVSPRKIMTPRMEKERVTKAGEKIKFRTGTGLKTLVNGDDADE